MSSERKSPLPETSVSNVDIQLKSSASPANHHEQHYQLRPNCSPIVAQPKQGAAPTAGTWMSVPALVPTAIPNCPPGLEYLTLIDQLLVKQKVELFEAFTGFETNNKFVIKNAIGQNVFWAVEDNDCCNRNCCGPMRSFDMKIFDATQREVMHFYRPCACACTCCCVPCCPDTIQIASPPGNVIGGVEQEWSLCYPKFSVKDRDGNVKLRIEGPLFTSSCCCNDVVFNILSTNGTEIGKITKQWSGFTREAFTDADHFGINFPMDLDVHMKATLLAACILIDMMYFEHNQN